MIRLESILRTFELYHHTQSVFDDAQIAHGVCTNGGGMIKAMHKVMLALLLATAPSIMAAPSTAAVAIAEHTDPVKLATLKGEGAANPRLQKCVYWLACAEEQGEKPEVVLDESAKLNRTAGTPYAGFVSWGLLENLKIAKELGLLTPEGMAELKQGKSATITKGEYAGQKAEADDVIPMSLCPELKNHVTNLELLPASLKRSKSDKVTERAKVFAKELYEAKLLTEEGWKKVQGLKSGPSALPTSSTQEELRRANVARWRIEQIFYFLTITCSMQESPFQRCLVIV